MKNFELVRENTITVHGRTLYQIRALVDYPNSPTKAGELGGYIEKEENLSDWAWVSDNAQVSGDAWVSDNAQVSGDARVSGKTWVSGNARVSGDAWAYGDTWIYGNARVSGNTWVSGNARVYGDAVITKSADVIWFSHVGAENGTLTAYKTKDGTIELTRGCFRGSIEEFTDASKKKHDIEIFESYQALIKAATILLNR